MGVDACINAYIGKVYLIYSASPYYAHAKSILNATRDFLDKAIGSISDGIRINAR